MARCCTKSLDSAGARLHVQPSAVRRNRNARTLETAMIYRGRGESTSSPQRMIKSLPQSQAYAYVLPPITLRFGFRAA